jgi:hypothetical protein
MSIFLDDSYGYQRNAMVILTDGQPNAAVDDVVLFNTTDNSILVSILDLLLLSSLRR